MDIRHVHKNIGRVVLAKVIDGEEPRVVNPSTHQDIDCKAMASLTPSSHAPNPIVRLKDQAMGMPSGIHPRENLFLFP
jgi:hypothetical protein